MSRALEKPRAPCALRLLIACLGACLVGGCSKSDHAAAPATRTYGMGFSWFPPHPDLSLALQVIDLFASRADFGLIAVSPPWTQLLAGGDPTALVQGSELGVADYYRGKGLRVVVSIDPTNGLDRSQDAPELVAAGRSLAEPAVQQLYRDYAVAMQTLLAPDLLGLASETNLVRAIAPPALYDGVRQAAVLAATSVRMASSSAQLFVTVQVETAWGKPGGSFVGIGQDLTDFPFLDALGLSSYPYLGGFPDPENIPPDYYARLTSGTALPCLLIEGGWPSVSLGTITSDPGTQQRYVDHQSRLLDQAGAIGWFQIMFTDLEVAAYPPGAAPFADLGLVTTTLVPKPALVSWDAIFARPRS